MANNRWLNQNKLHVHPRFWASRRRQFKPLGKTFTLLSEQNALSELTRDLVPIHPCGTPQRRAHFCTSLHCFRKKAKKAKFCCPTVKGFQSLQKLFQRPTSTVSWQDSLRPFPKTKLAHPLTANRRVQLTVLLLNCKQLN